MLNRLRSIKSRLLKFCVFKIIFPNWYRWNAKGKIKEGKVVFIEVRLPSISNSFQLIYSKLKNEYTFEITECFLRNGFVKHREYLKNGFWMIKEIADAQYIFVNEASNILGTCPLRKETKVVQLWHGCGAFKKFGFSTADLIFGDDRRNQIKYPSHKNYHMVTVSSPEVVWAYEEAMMFKSGSGIVRPIGVSRTDIFFDDDNLQNAKNALYNIVKENGNRKIVLYAPTFRGRVATATAPDRLDIRELKEAVGEEYILLIKHHPLVKNLPEIPNDCRDFAYDITKSMSIEDAMCVADICISDYSSLVFEYSLFERPMLFFAYDIEEYIDWRGFYYPFDEFTPGPIVDSTEEIIEYLKKPEMFDLGRVKEFKNKFMSACDGHATERILTETFGEDLRKYRR